MKASCVLNNRSFSQHQAVNWCELTVTRADGKQLYQNAFATNHLITQNTVAAIVCAGRTRWKVENENNNTLKTKGYHLEPIRKLLK